MTSDRTHNNILDFEIAYGSQSCVLLVTLTNKETFGFEAVKMNEYPRSNNTKVTGLGLRKFHKNPLSKSDAHARSCPHDQNIAHQTKQKNV